MWGLVGTVSYYGLDFGVLFYQFVIQSLPFSYPE